MIYTIVSDPIRRAYRIQELRGWLRRANYPDTLIHRAIANLNRADLKDLRTKTPKQEKDQLIFVQSNNPNNPQVFSKMLTFIDYLKTDPKYSILLKGVEIMKSESQPPNLERMFKRSYFGEEQFNFGSHKCGGCSSCKFMEERDSVYFHRVDIDFDIKHNFNCDSGYLIYKLTCFGCNEYYIGHTTCLRDRIQSHKLCIRNVNYRNQKVYKHIFDCAGNLEVPFKMAPFFKVKGETLKTTEDFFIEKMSPLLNST